MSLPDRPDRVGETVGGKYRVVRFLAEGGMAAVYEARHLVVNRRFAIKFLRVDLAAQRGALERFQREASVAGGLEQENVAAVMDFGVTADGAPFIVMEYLAGETLASLLRRLGKLPVGRAADLCVQASLGLAAAHAAGVVHRDLKPQNLFVCRRSDGSDLLKVLDFGVAKLEEAESHGMVTATGATLGTPFYMAPEQARGEDVCDERTDVYGLGAVLYEMLSGRRPHVGDSNNAVMHHICTQAAIPLSDVTTDLAPELGTIVHRCLAGTPADRFASMGALAEALARFAQRQSWPAPAGVPDEPPTPSPPASKPATSVPRRRRWLLVPLALALLGAAAVGAYLMVGHAPRRHVATLPRDTQFFVPPVQPGATAQIASLIASPRQAGALTAMTSTPRGLWLIGGSPDDVRATVHKTVLRAMRETRVPILVPYNHPYRDCAGYGAGGTEDLAAYRAWIDAFVGGLGNERAVVVLEPHALGIIPNSRRLDGQIDWCRPSATNGQGDMAPAKGATPEDRYALLNDALDRLASGAPRALVYLDGTHSAWLPVGESAYRLARAGIHKAQGFTVNASSYETTADSIQYGTWIAKCLAYAQFPENKNRGERAYAECASRGPSRGVAEVQAWYAAHVDSRLASSPALAHFVIDTSRNGRGPLDVSQFGKPPYSQPQDVLDKLAGMSWCNPPGATLGQPPTVNTGVPLVDAFLWIKNPGESDGSCNIAGGGRAWDYARYNPWGISGEALAHFDPLWGMVDPAVGEWFPAQALQLALGDGRPIEKP